MRRETASRAVGGAGNPACPVVDSDLQTRQRRLPHWQIGGSHYFITFSSVRAELPEPARAIVLECLQFGHGRDYDLISAVVMPDHVHCIIQPAEAAKGQWVDLGRILRAIKGVSARRINQLLSTAGSVWQDESWDRIIRDEDEMNGKLAYMMHNPVKAGLVERPEDYEFLLMSGWD